MSAAISNVRWLMTIVVVLLIGAAQATNHPSRAEKQSLANKVSNERGMYRRMTCQIGLELSNLIDY